MPQVVQQMAVESNMSGSCRRGSTWRVMKIAGCIAIALLALSRTDARNCTAQVGRTVYACYNCDLTSQEAFLIPFQASTTVIQQNTNKITILPEGVFAGLVNLLQLRLANNAISFVPANSFTDLVLLQWLDLGTNHISMLPNDVMIHLGQLTDCRLNDNDLSVVIQRQLVGLNSIEILELNRNELTWIEADTFTNMSNLTALYLARNQLSTLPTGLFLGLNRLDLLMLQGNAHCLRFQMGYFDKCEASTPKFRCILSEF